MQASHYRLYQARGKARRCVWGCTARRYEWANLTGDYENPGDYAEMCTSCHHHYDNAVRRTWLERTYGASDRAAHLVEVN